MMILRVFPTYAKKKCSCNACDEEGEKSIAKDDPAVVIIWKIGGFVQKKHYHLGCVLEVLQDFCEDWFTRFTPGHTKIGRPQKSPNPIEYRKLKALQRYHKKQGHKERVRELEEEIQVLLKVTQKKVEPEPVQVEEGEEPLSEEEKALAEIQQTWEGGEKAFPRPNKEKTRIL